MNTQTFEPDATLIDRDLAYRAHSGTTFTPDVRRDQEIEAFKSDLTSIYHDLLKIAKTESDIDIIDVEMIEFQKRYADKYNVQLSARARVMSTMIAGPSKFPTRRNEKASNAYEKGVDEMMTWRGRAVNAISKNVKDNQIAEAGGEIEVMKSKIESAEEMQTIMKQCNKIIRSKKLSDDEKIIKMVEIGISEDTVREVMKPDYMGRVGFASYELTNNNANIKRMKARVIEMQTREDTPTSEIEFNGGTIIDNCEDDRVQIFFDENPDDEMIAKLRGSGWHWKRSIEAWQRKRTANAMVSAKQILEV